LLCSQVQMLLLGVAVSTCVGAGYKLTTATGALGKSATGPEKISKIRSEMDKEREMLD